jgi:GntR family transcriptional regulator
MQAAKYRVIATEIEDRIRRGEYAHRDRLPGELDLAEEFSVSRGTIRQALATLQREGLIETAVGAGSFVTYDGHPIADGFSWSKSLERGGVTTSTRLVALGKLELPDLAEDLSLASALFLTVERIRVKEDGEAISLERSRLPWRDSFDAVLATGLVNDSLQQTLAAHGVVSVSSREVIGLAILGTQDAKLLARSAGEAFLENEQTSFDADGNVVETVTSLLHPDHFRLEHTFGARP